MYVGRFVVVGPGIGAYRVSSRSFPNRRIDDRGGGTLTVGPTPEAEPTDNPYVSYNCVRVPTRETAVLGNGSHVDPVAEKIGLGYPPRDALVTALHALDFEKDDYDTPRIGGVVTPDSAHVGIVRRDALTVERVGRPTLVATYEKVRPEPVEFDVTVDADHAGDPTAIARRAYEFPYEHPVCAAGVLVGDDRVETGSYSEN